MPAWPDRRILDLLGIELPILQAPMAGAVLADMAVAVAEAGGLGALPAALLDAEGFRSQLGIIRQRTSKPINVNFFCHRPPAPDPARAAAWKERLAPYYRELGLDPEMPTPAGQRAPFDDAFCTLVEEFRPEVVSFHFGLPEPGLLARVRATGAKVIASATTVDEAVWLDGHGCDAIIAQGAEAGGHRGMFLDDRVEAQVGTLALVPQVVDAVARPGDRRRRHRRRRAASPPPSPSAPAPCRSAPPTSSAPRRPSRRFTARRCTRTAGARPRSPTSSPAGRRAASSTG